MRFHENGDRKIETLILVIFDLIFAMKPLKKTSISSKNLTKMVKFYSDILEYFSKMVDFLKPLR